MNTRIRPAGAPGYRLIRWIGTSGTATVYAAGETSNGRLAAVKIFHRVDAEGLARLEQTLRANVRLSHPNIVGIHAIGYTSDGRLFHSMPLLLGLEQARHELFGKSPAVAALLRDLLEGLGHAHQCGMVHGDIKPSNVLLDKQGRAYLADFGIATCMAGPNLPSIEASRYLSPEQVRGQPPGPRSDIYSIGVLAHALLTRTTSTRHAPTEVTANAGQPAARLPSEKVAWQAWIDRALAPLPEQRFQSAREMTIAMAGMGGHHGHARGHAIRTTQDPQPPRRKLSTAAVAVTIAALVALASWSVWGNRDAPNTQATTATSQTPGLSTGIRRATPAPPADAGSVSPLAQNVRELVTSADTLRTHGHWFSPAFHNAASHYLAALALDPGNPAATAGIDTMLAALRQRLDKTWDDHRRHARAVSTLKHGDMLAKHADASARRDWHRYRERLAKRVGDALRRAARTHDSRGFAALVPLAQALPVKIPRQTELATAQHAPPTAGTRLRDHGGPVLVYVPAADGAPAFAIERVEVTRADYAVFARTTHRPAAACRQAHNPFSRLRHFTWQAPGFKQGGNHPVVCVSWNDAAAYAAWLSKSTGEAYRLPSNSEWLRAARGMPNGTPCQLGNVDDVNRRSRFDDDRWNCNDGAAQTAPVGHYAASGVGAYDMYGNVSEWLAGGSPGSRRFRGISWRDGSHESALDSHGNADTDVGYTSVGFRVVRVIDAAHPPPPAMPGS